MTGPSTAKSRAERRRRITLAQLGAYALIVSTALFGFYQIDQTQADLCDTTAQNRDAVRNVVNAVYELAIGAAQRQPDAPPLTESEQRELNAYLERVEKFHESQLALLDKEPC